METALQQAINKAYERIDIFREYLSNVKSSEQSMYYQGKIDSLLSFTDELESLIPVEKEQHEGKFEEGYKQACIDNLIEPDDEVLFEHIKDIRQTYQSK